MFNSSHLAFTAPMLLRPNRAMASMPHLLVRSPPYFSPASSTSRQTLAPQCRSSPPRHRTARRRLATHRTVVPDGTVHPLKGDITPTPFPSPNPTTDPTSSPALPPPPTDREGRVLLKGLTLREMQHWVEHTLNDKPFRARQLWRWLYRPDKLAATFEEMSDLSKAFRETLSTTARIDTLSLDTMHESADGTRKMTYALDGGGRVESVVIPADGRTTLCVSSQWGCALNCQFCLTGRTGFKRSLSHAEIVDQVVIAKRLFESTGMRIANVVFMGEGEPFHNLENVMRAVETLTSLDGLQISHNKVTVSTSGLIPELRRFAKDCKANLAVSLHATNDELRSWLMPINRKYPLPELMQTLRDAFPRSAVRQQKVFFQYVMLKGVNDSLLDAKELLRLTSGVPCKINLIHFNAHEGTEFEASDEDTMLAFQDFLVKKGMTVTIRRSRGDDMMMACGQLGKLGEQQAPRMRVPERYAHALKRKRETTSVVETMSS